MRSHNDRVGISHVNLEQTLEAFFRDHAPLAGGDTILIAFSGGADSTALLDAMCAFASPRGIRIRAVHIDHQLDPGSQVRADGASTAAAALGVELIVNRQDVRAQMQRGESLEMGARRVRYRELEKAASAFGARYIATAHHRDDQAETVLLRLAAGHGLSALAAIPAQRGSIIRPLLGKSRKDLLRYLRHRGLTWIEDPTNRDLTTPRNRLRRLLIPILRAKDPNLSIRLASLAQAAKGVNTRLAREFDQLLTPSREGSAVTVSRRVLETLPATVVPHAIVHLLRCCGSRRRPSRRALGYAQALLSSQAPIGVDLGGGWRIEEARTGKLRILRTPEPTPLFAYDLTVPGEVHLDELASSLRVTAGRVEPWMFQGARLRAGLSLRLEPRERLTVRNRRPGDRVQPLGSRSRQKLKSLLINHGIPKCERDRLPLLCHSERILWVPGVTIDHEARIRAASREGRRAGSREEPDIWVAEIIPDE